MRLLFDLLATQPISSSVKYNGGAEYVRRIFLETVARSDDSVNIFCTYNSKLAFEDYLREVAINKGVVFLDLAKNSINEYIRQNRIEKVFLGIVQRYSGTHFDQNVEVVMVWHDVRDLEIVPTRESLWNFSDVSTLSGRIKLIIKLLFFDGFLKMCAEINMRNYATISVLAQRKRTRVITDSVHSKYTILSKFPAIEKSKIDVLSLPEITYSNEKTECSELIGEKYWLLVSADRWNKNALSVIKILSKVEVFRNKKIKLVLVGNIKNFNLYNKIKKCDWIVVYDYLERSKLEWLYANCSLLLYPSFAEGFGIPPIEAMRYGKPIVASATSAIIEIYGDAPIYICPYNKLEIETRLRSVLDMDLNLISQKSNHKYKQILKRQHHDLEVIVDIILSR